MTERCPRCRSSDVSGRKITVPNGICEHSRLCGNCGLFEVTSTDQPDWRDVLARWTQQDAPPREAEVVWLGTLETGFEARINTPTGVQRWKLEARATEPRFTLFIDETEAERIASESWPRGWSIANTPEGPPEKK